jgi:hypothetical protein
MLRWWWLIQLASRAVPAQLLLLASRLAPKRAGRSWRQALLTKRQRRSRLSRYVVGKRGQQLKMLARML